MGGGQSKTETVSDFATTVVTNVVVNVTNKYKTTTNSTQKVKIRCDNDVYQNCISSCAEATASYESMLGKLVKAGAINGSEMVSLLSTYDSPACRCCSVANVDQSMVMNITTTDINDNDIANSIQSGIVNKLDEMLTSGTSGTVGWGESEIASATKIKSIVENNFDTNIVNETLRQFNFDQTLEAENGSIRDVSQMTVATLVASNIVKNAIESNSELKTEVEKLAKGSATTSGVGDNMEGAVDSIATNLKDAIGSVAGMMSSLVFLWIAIAITIMIVVLVFGKKLLMGPLGLLKSKQKSGNRGYQSQMYNRQSMPPTYSSGPPPMYSNAPMNWGPY